MSDDRPTVYDPDPMQLELGAFSDMGVEGLDLDALSNPQGVRFLIYLRRLALSQLKVAQDRNETSQKEVEAMRGERESLRIKVAKLESQVNTSWIEIPVGILTGFGINLITSSNATTPKETASLGWVLLIAGVAILLCLRGAQILGMFKKVGD